MQSGAEVAKLAKHVGNGRTQADCLKHAEKYLLKLQQAKKDRQSEIEEPRKRLDDRKWTWEQEMEFEKAAGLRDRITALTQVQTNQGINPLGVNEADVISLHLEGGQACVQVFFIRANQNWGNQDFYPRVGSDVDAAEVLLSLIHI